MGFEIWGSIDTSRSPWGLSHYGKQQFYSRRDEDEGESSLKDSFGMKADIISPSYGDLVPEYFTKISHKCTHINYVHFCIIFFTKHVYKILVYMMFIVVKKLTIMTLCFILVF